MSRVFRACLAAILLVILAWRSYAFRWVLWPAAAAQTFLAAPTERTAAFTDMLLLALCALVWGAVAYALMLVTDPRRGGAPGRGSSASRAR